jgi:hypothetical protein
MQYTLSFSEDSKGWTSFFSFIPEKMIGMNSYFYTFKNGNLYRHNSNDLRNNFYGVQYSSRIKGVFNVENGMVKNFKTISLNSDDSWNCSIITDMDSGFISNSYFTLKEGDYFGYIRRYVSDDNLSMRSAQGIGDVSFVNSSNASAVVVLFNFVIGSIINVGDMIYKNNSGSIIKIGEIVAVSGNSITVNTTITGGSIPSISDYILCLKNSTAESYGARGYYMQFDLENANTSRVELFSVGSNIFKSYP